MDVFRQQRTWNRAWRLGISQLACVGRHTVTGLLSTAGRQFIDWTSDYRLYSQDCWNPRELFVPVARGILEMLPATAPVVAAVDDTVIRKTGPKIPGVAYRRDPLSPPFQVNLVRGQRFLQLSALLPAAEVPGPARAIPLRFDHAPSVPKPRKKAPPEVWQAYRQQRRRQNLNTQAVEVLQQMRTELDERHGARERPFIVGVDGGYTNEVVLKGLPERTTLIGRIRKDADLYHALRSEDQRPVGTTRHYGQPASTPEELRQDDTMPWQEVTAFAAGRKHAFRVKTIAPIFWKKAGARCPLRLVVIAPVGYRLRKGSKLLYRQPASLICTDPDLPLAQVVQYYLWRWEIEVNHRDEKQIIGVGEAQVRAPQSVDRQPAFAVASYAMLLLAAAQAFGSDARQGLLPLPKWQEKTARPRLSTQELIRQLRSEVWAEALDRIQNHSDHFVTTTPTVTKCPESQLPAASALLYAASG